MHCPYACKTKTEFESWYQTYNENGQVEKCITSRNYCFTYEECLKEDCGAWYNGRCNYKEDGRTSS